jgi:hypothetical protein
MGRTRNTRSGVGNCAKSAIGRSADGTKLISFTLRDLAAAGFGLQNLAHCDARPFAHIMRIARGIWANGERREAAIFDF